MSVAQHFADQIKNQLNTPIGNTMLLLIEEYEHGTADIDSLHGITLEQYAAVCLDLLQAMNALDLL